MKNILIVEDKLIMAQNLATIVKDVNENADIYIAQDKVNAYTYAMEIDIDLFLVDVILNPKEAGDVSGLAFARKIREIENYRFVPIIIVTSLEDPKMYAYSEIHCYNYIEKPYDRERTKNIIKQALEYKKTDSYNSRYLYKKDGIIYSIDLEKVIYIESSGKKVKFVTEKEKISVPYKSFGKLLKEINNKNFMQCSRQCIVNAEYIENIDGVNRFIKLKDMSDSIEIGTSMKKKFIMEFENVK